MRDQKLVEEYEKALFYLPPTLREALQSIPEGEKARIQEIRLRAGRPLSVFDGAVSRFVTGRGALTYGGNGGFVVDQGLIQDAFVRLCDYSVHTHQGEMERGFVTTPKGDRVGLCASVVKDRDGTVSCREISSLSLRISREIPGAGRELCRRWDLSRGLLIGGGPGTGKTTLLRDLGRFLASGDLGPCRKVVYIDERYELSAMFRGVPRRDIGLCGDAICGLPKGEAIEQAVRTLSPEFLLCDEIGSLGEVREIASGLACGVKFLVTVHCGSLEELLTGPIPRALMDTGAFGGAALLDSPARPSQVVRLMTKEEFYHGKGAGPAPDLLRLCSDRVGKGFEPGTARPESGPVAGVSLSVPDLSGDDPGGAKGDRPNA